LRQTEGHTASGTEWSWHAARTGRSARSKAPRSMAPRSKTWRGTIDHPTDEQLEYLRSMARSGNMHLAMKHHRGIAAEVMIVFRQPRRASKPGASEPPLATWTPASFEMDWPLLKHAWKDDTDAEFFPASCQCHLCRERQPQENALVAGGQKPQKRRRADASCSTCTTELPLLRQQLAAAERRWERALPILQSFLSPEALQLLEAGDGELPQPLAITELPIADAIAEPLD